MISAAQVREARRLLGWSYATLAKRAHASMTMLAKLEQGDESPKLDFTRRAVQSALEAASVEFLNHGQLGVRLSAHNQSALKQGSAHLQR